MCASPGTLDLTVAAADVQGTLPKELRGSVVYANGPGWTQIGDRTAHPFDGHGYLRRFEFDQDGGLTLRARFVETPSYVAEAEAGKMMHKGFATLISSRFWENLLPTPLRNVANTTVVPWNDRLLLGWEGGAPTAVDPITLETYGEEHFGGALTGQATLAHMRRDPQAGRLTLCSVAMGRQTTLTFREVDLEGRVTSETRTSIDGLLFLHDYAFTADTWIVGGNPLRMRPVALAKSFAGLAPFFNGVSPDTSKPGTLHLIDRKTGELRTVTLPKPAFIVHYGNAFTKPDGTIVVDVCAFSSFEFGNEFGYQGPKAPFDPALPDQRRPQRLFRVEVAPGASQATWRLLTDHGVDFPRFHAEHEGIESPLLFGATRRDTRYSDPFDTLLGLDHRTGTEDLWTAPDNVFVGEPLFAPSSEAADEGHVICMLSDGIAETSILTVFDARALAKGPIAWVFLPLLPVAFHGEWVSAPNVGASAER